MDVLEKARARRTAARAAAERAALDWQDAVVESIDQLVDQLRINGVNRLASFEAAVRPALDGEAWEEREDLVAASFASDAGVVNFTPSDDERWATAVELWDDLRSALSRIHGTDVPASLVVDLDARVAVGYEPLYCPDVGIEADLILHLVRADSDEPFASLLLELPDPDAAMDRVNDLLDRYGLEPPTKPEHEPGECDLGLGDEED
ncbi:hypothetical protein [Cryptosporangium phraense]|uniref:Uncharacterized protein n=1 Tax=Cryptosporangium phraense TaxID=2593070 RepID=A0A545AKJ0_9ACTN|nr:hypothetical protein [Cryptosporangium phraense]TQS41791.1 hypothetical protein FL583_27530 [Cryptosporangium phraense]